MPSLQLRLQQPLAFWLWLSQVCLSASGRGGAGTQPALLWYSLNPSFCVDHNKLWKILKEMGIADHLTCLLRNLYAGQETELHMEQRTGSKSEKEYIKTVYCHSAYLTFMQSALEMPEEIKEIILKEISPEYSLEGLIAEAETPIFWPPDAKNQLLGKDPDAGKD